VIDITTAAGVAPGTSTYIFTEKISVFRYLLVNLGRTLRREIEAASAGCKTRLRAGVHGVQDVFRFRPHAPRPV
jgi:AcrR family transcriptional regulator